MQVPADNLRQAYDTAYRKACEEFRRWDAADMAASCGAAYDAAGRAITLRYAGEEYRIAWPDGEVSSDSAANVPTTVRIILLHYLLRGNGQPLQGRLISFKEIPNGGMVYLDAYNKRIINYLIAVFGKNPPALVEAGRLIGGAPAACGHYGVTVEALPRLPVTFALWAGDEEFPPGAAVLYDASIPFYLPTEDVVEATAHCVRRLAKAAKTLAQAEAGQNPGGNR